MKHFSIWVWVGMVALVAGTHAARCDPVAWPQFRGPNCQGVAKGRSPPVHFGPTNSLLWKAEAFEGVSSPCIWGRRLFLTAREAGRFELLCLDRGDGRLLWRQTLPEPPGGFPRTHPMNSVAAATPATDGRRVFVYGAGYGLRAYDFEGRALWTLPVAQPMDATGTASSPVVARGRVILKLDGDAGGSRLLAVASRTGRLEWSTPRPGCVASYATPVVWRHGTTEEVVVAGSLRVVGYGVGDGRERWGCAGLEFAAVCPTPAIGGARLYATSYSAGGSPPTSFRDWGSQYDRDADGRLSRSEAPPGFVESGGFDMADADRDGFVTEAEWDASQRRVHSGTPGLFAVSEPGQGDITATHVVWRDRRLAGTVASPLYYEGRLYVVQDGGRLSCVDPADGAPRYQQERLGVEGAYHASPVAAGGHVFLSSRSGSVVVVRAGDRCEVLAVNPLGEGIAATPAIVDEVLYVRTTSHLWAFGRR
jgi:outer membrane protein assembly factor BamB